MNKKILFTLIPLVVILMGTLIFRAPFSPESDGDVKTSPSAQVTLANPASTFCTENGGTTRIINTMEGQRGECSFANGTTCEEWALFRGDCNVEGVSNTGHYSEGENEVKLVYRVKTKTAILLAPSLGYENISLVQAISASGARYLSADSKIEFWEHQGEGKLSVDGKEIFLGKLKQVE